MARLLFINNVDRLSGPGSSFLKLHKYLKSEHDVTVAVPGEGSFTQVLDEKGISWHVFPFRFRHIPALVRLIQRGDYDLVYGNNFSNPAFKALLAAKLLGKPFIWHIREMFSPDLRSSKARRLRYADAIIAVSKASALCIKHHLPGKDVSIVHNGIEIEDFAVTRNSARQSIYDHLGLADEDVLVISVGHICARKNQQGAVEIAAEVIKKYPLVKFCFLGMLDHSPEYTCALKEKIARLGIENNLHMPGFRNNAAAYLRAADIFLHTSTKDPHPRSVLEGMAAELPVVAYDVDGVSETVVSRETGYLVQPGDTNEAAKALITLLEKPKLRKRMGLQGYQRVKLHFTAQQTAEMVNEVIMSVLSKTTCN